VSYKAAESMLMAAAAAVGVCNIDALACRGNLERNLTPLQLLALRDVPIVMHFMSALSIVIGGMSPLDARDEEEHSSILARSLAPLLGQWRDRQTIAAFPPPLRSLIGEVRDISRNSTGTFDIVLLRDREHPQTRFSLVLNCQGDKVKKVARLLAEFDPAGEGHVFLRGYHVDDDFRGRGISSLVLSTWLMLCFKCFGKAPRTRLIDKPLIALSLESLGFMPEYDRMPVYVGFENLSPPLEAGGGDERSGDCSHAVGSSHGGATIVCPEDPRDLGSHLSYNFCKSQRIKLSEQRPENARRVHIRTPFRHPEPAILRKGLDERVSCTFYSARLIAFLSCMDDLRAQIYADDEAGPLSFLTMTRPSVAAS